MPRAALLRLRSPGPWPRAQCLQRFDAIIPGGRLIPIGTNPDRIRLEYLTNGIGYKIRLLFGRRRTRAQGGGMFNPGRQQSAWKTGPENDRAFGRRIQHGCDPGPLECGSAPAPSVTLLSSQPRMSTALRLCATTLFMRIRCLAPQSGRRTGG
jgi:hypothetical protein